VRSFSPHAAALVLVASFSVAACTPAATHASAAPPGPGSAASGSNRASYPIDASNEAAFTESAARRMGAVAPDLRIRVTGPLALEIDQGRGQGHEAPKQISLQRVWTTCGQDPSGCEAEVDHFVAVLVRILASKPEVAQRSQILPELRPREYIDAMGTMATNAVVQPFVGDLVVVYVVDSPDSTRSLTPSDAQALHLSSTDVAAVARENLSRRLAPLPFGLDAIQPGEVHVLATGNFYESSRLLFEEDWAAIAARAPTPIVVGVPENDVVLFVAGIDGDRLARLRAVVREGYEKAARPVSPNLYRWAGGEGTGGGKETGGGGGKWKWAVLP
jgi:uncharacterized protein YtpQ (UPF0354 family)